MRQARKTTSWAFNGDQPAVQACNCIGPQDGQPKCPCMMRGLIQRDGRWIEPEKDLGPVLDLTTTERADE